MTVSGPLTLQDWLRAHGEPVFHGVIRQSCSDFEVSERLGFEPSGSGEHDFLRIEKTDANTAWVARRLARHAGIPPGDVGVAGMKDRRAVARQWFSVRRTSATGTDWDGFAAPGVRILEVCRHDRKLRRGAHRSNRFRITVRARGIPAAALEERLATIRTKGVPSYFGEQRFGRDGGNLVMARRLFRGERLPRGRRGIALSAARALVFNHVLQRRVGDGTWDRVLPGETACLEGSNSLFTVSDVDDELRRRCRALDVHPGGPLWGRGAPSSTGIVRELELAIAGRDGDLAAGLDRCTEESRRALRLVEHDLAWEVRTASVRLEFELRAGGFATAVLRELTRYA